MRATGGRQVLINHWKEKANSPGLRSRSMFPAAKGRSGGSPRFYNTLPRSLFATART